MNREEYIMQELHKHYEEFKKVYPDRELFALCLQGSQNYELDLYTDEYKSDIDTKAIVIPSFEEIVLNKKPISTTHIIIFLDNIGVLIWKIMNILMLKIFD